MVKLRNNWGWTGLGIVCIGALVSTILISISVGLGIADNILWNEGVEATVTGTIQTHQLRYNKLYNMEYTEMIILTYTGDTHYLKILGHHTEFECDKMYQIRVVRVDYWAHLITANELVSFAEL